MVNYMERVVDLTDPHSVIPRISTLLYVLRTQDTLFPLLVLQIDWVSSYNVPTVRKVGGLMLLSEIAASVSVS